QKCRFAAAAGADDRHEVARMNFKRDAANGVNRTLLLMVSLLHIAGFHDHRISSLKVPATGSLTAAEAGYRPAKKPVSSSTASARRTDAGSKTKNEKSAGKPGADFRTESR